MRLPRLDRPERAAHDLFIDRRKLVTRTGKETRNHREAVADRGRARRPQRERCSFLRQTIESLGVRALAGHGPKNVAKMLLHERYFRLHRELYIAEVCA